MCLGNGPVFCQFIVCGVGLAGKWDGKILDLIILVLHLFAYFPFKELLRRVRGHFGRTPANHPASQPGSASARKASKPGFGQASWQYYFCYQILSNSVKLTIWDKKSPKGDSHAGKKLEVGPKYILEFQSGHFTRKLLQNRTATHKNKN